MKRFLNHIRQLIPVLGVLALLLAATVAFAQEAAVAVAAALPPEPQIDSIFKEMMKAFQDWKAIGWQAGLAGLVTAIISTTKNSLLRSWIWDKLGAGKILVAPALAMLAFAVAVKPFSWAVVIAGLTTGAAAVYLHQLLDALKSMPWLGEKWKAIVDFLGKLLKKPDAPAEGSKQ